MLRHQFFTQEDTSMINTMDITMYNLRSVDWREFEFTNGYIPHRLSSQEVDKFYLVTKQYLGELFNEDLILLINGIADPTDLKVGQVIKIPKAEDLDAFLNKIQLSRLT